MGLIRGVARTAVIAGTATAVSNRVSRRQAGRWSQQEQQEQQEQQQQQEQEYQRQQMAAMQAQQSQQAQAQQGDPMQGKIEQLKSLADLKAQGILTEEEFQAQKNVILNG